MSSQPPRPPLTADTAPGAAIAEIWPKRPLAHRAGFASGDNDAVKVAALRNLDEAAARYEQALAAVVPVTGPRFGVTMVTVGADGVTVRVTEAVDV